MITVQKIQPPISTVCTVLMYRVQTFQKDFWFYTEAVFFSVDRAAKRLSICPWHRNFFGIYWGDNSMKCQFKGHPVGSKAKTDRGITPTLSTEYWLLTRQLIPVGSGKSQIYKSLSMKINGIRSFECAYMYCNSLGCVEMPFPTCKAGRLKLPLVLTVPANTGQYYYFKWKFVNFVLFHI